MIHLHDIACGARNPRPGRAAGNALIEFVLTLPILIFMTGLTIYMSLAMLTKQGAIVDARHALWGTANDQYWSDLKLEGWSGAPGYAGSGGQNRPRGEGEELDRLRPEVEPGALARVGNGVARDYWNRVWGNLPGRFETHASRSFETGGSLWNFIERTAEARHYRDSSAWHFDHLDVWKIMRSGPLRPIWQEFETVFPYNPSSPLDPGNPNPDPFKRTRDDIMYRWWHGSDILNAEANNAGQTGG